MSQPQEGTVLDMFSSFVNKAEHDAAKKGDHISIILAPTSAVFDLFNEFERHHQMVGPKADGEKETYSVCIYRGHLILGIIVQNEKHPFYGTISAWTDDQISLPDGLPLLTGQRPPASDEWEHTLWGTRMEEWLASINHAVTYAMSHLKPICGGKILP
jgi:hypothetical protein